MVCLMFQFVRSILLVYSERFCVRSTDEDLPQTTVKRRWSVIVFFKSASLTWIFPQSHNPKGVYGLIPIPIINCYKLIASQHCSSHVIGLLNPDRRIDLIGAEGIMETNMYVT